MWSNGSTIPPGVHRVQRLVTIESSFNPISGGSVDQRRLEAFIVLTQEMNFTRAAARLNVTQSTLSATIKALEADLATTLFTRSTRAVALTEAGQTFLLHARRIIDAVDAARTAVDPSGQMRGTLTVGTLTGLRVVDVPGLAGDFHRRHPMVQLRLETSRRGTAEHAERIKEGSMDVAFLGTDTADLGLRATPIKRYELSLVTARDHPLAQHQNVLLADIANESFVDLPMGFAQRTVADKAFADRGLSRRVPVEASDLTTLPEFVAHGLGVALMPSVLMTHGEHQLAVIPLADMRVGWTLNVVVAANHPPARAVEAFLGMVPSHLRADVPF